MSDKKKFHLPIQISKKGSKAVTATDLFKVLQLPAHLYNAHLEKWLEDVYQFSDEVRKAIKNKDYAPIQFIHNKGKDYYLSLELAKLICLNSQSRVKMQLAQLLIALEHKPSIEIFGKRKLNRVKEHINVKNNMINQKSQGVQLGLW